MDKILINTTIYAVGNILPKAAGLILLPIYTRYLIPADYGIVNSMQVLQAIVAVVFTLSLERSIFRLYWNYKTDESRKDFLGTITIFICVNSFLMLMILFVFHSFVAGIYKAIEFYPFFAYGISIAFISVFSQIPYIYLMLKQKAVLFVILSIIQFIVSTSLIVWFIIIRGEGAAGFLKGQLLGVVLLLPVFIFITYKMMNFRFDSSILKDSLSFSLPMIPTVLSAWILQWTDRIFIEHYFTLNDVGIYSLGYRIAGIVILFTGSFSHAYAPVFFKLANSEDQQSARKAIFNYNHIYLVGVIFIVFVISFFSQEVIILLFENKYQNSYIFIPLISFSYLFSQATWITGRFFEQSRKMKQNMVVAIMAAILNIILNFLLISKYGAFGAAYATIISMAFVIVVSYYYTKRHCYFIPFNWNRLLPFAILLFSIYIFFQSIQLEMVNSLILKTLVILSIIALFFKRYFHQFRALFETQ